MSDNLQQFINDRFNDLIQSYQQAVGSFPDDAVFIQQLKAVLVASNFAYDQWQLQPQQLKNLYQSADYQQSYHPSIYQQRLTKLLSNCYGENNLKKILRHFYHYEILRIIWRDINGLSPLSEVMVDLSALADSCIQQAALFLQQQLEQSMGVPCDDKGQHQQLQIIAMGKLGASELNL